MSGAQTPKRFFRANPVPKGPATVAEAAALEKRTEAYERVRAASIHLLVALKQWPGFDATGNIDGAIDHTLVNMDRLDTELDALHDAIKAFRGQGGSK